MGVSREPRVAKHENLGVAAVLVYDLDEALGLLEPRAVVLRLVNVIAPDGL